MAIVCTTLIGKSYAELPKKRFGLLKESQSIIYIINKLTEQYYIGKDLI